MSADAHGASAEAERTGSSDWHDMAFDRHNKARRMHEELGNNIEAEHHKQMATEHLNAPSGKKVKSSSPDLSSLYLKGAAQEPTLEQIFARVGANGVPAAVTN